MTETILRHAASDIRRTKQVLEVASRTMNRTALSLSGQKSKGTDEAYNVIDRVIDQLQAQSTLIDRAIDGAGGIDVDSLEDLLEKQDGRTDFQTTGFGQKMEVSRG